MFLIVIVLVLVAFLSAILNGLASIGGGILFILSLIIISSLMEQASTLTMQAITNMAMFFTLACTVTGTWFYYKKQLIDKKMNIYFGSGTFVGGICGSLLANTLSDNFLQLAFFILTLLASFSLFLNKHNKLDIKVVLSLYWLILIGFIIGIIGGIFGIGLGFLLLPVMVIFYKIPIRDAIGSSLFCGGMLIVGALIGKIGTPFVDPFLLTSVIISGILGTLLGGVISVRLQSKYLQIIVAVVMAGISLKFLLEWII